VGGWRGERELTGEVEEDVSHDGRPFRNVATRKFD
jgi:hypothetical protein